MTTAMTAAPSDRTELLPFTRELLDTRGNYLVLITPADAEFLLTLNTNNRRPSKTKLVQYVRDMAAGRWDPDASDLKVATTGELIDGQNRLMACRLAGVPFRTLLRTGVRPEAKRHVDVGKKRTVADLLGMQGLPTGASMSLIGAAIALHQRYMDRMLNHGGKRALDVKLDPMTHDEVLAFVDKHPLVVEFGSDASTLHRQMPAIPGSSFGCFLMMAGEVDKDAAHLFSSRLRAGEFGSPVGHDPLVALVQYSARVRATGGMGNGGYRGRNAQESHLLALIRTWNAIRQGEQLERIVVKISDRLVLPV